MEINADELLVNAMRDGIREALKSRLNASYNNPFDDVMKRLIADHDSAVRQLLADALQSCLDDQSFRESVAAGVRQVLAKVLVQRFGGELEKAVNALKSDPTTRARITLALDEIVKDRVKAV